LQTKKTIFGSSEHWQAIQLRNEFLRKPVGFHFLTDFPAEEKDWLRFVIMDENDHVVGCVVAIKKNKTSVRLRQMVIHEKYQNQGVGRVLLSYVENELQRMGFEIIIIHARKDAVGFYKKTGYKQDGQEFIEVSIPHFAMIKSIVVPEAIKPK